MEKASGMSFGNRLAADGDNKPGAIRNRLLRKIGILKSDRLDKSSAIQDIYREGRRELLHDLEETLAELRYARNCFENAREPEIIEACVYEIKSAEARYSYLLRKAKETGVYLSRSAKRI
jgi:hypothetical protein